MENLRLTFLSLVAYIAIVAVQRSSVANAFVVVPSRPVIAATHQSFLASTKEDIAVSSTLTAAASSSADDDDDDDSNNPRLLGLAFALDDGTRKSHSMAENTAFVQGFFKGISSPDSYRNLLTSLYYVYKAMEEDVLDQQVSVSSSSSKSDEEEENDNDNDNSMGSMLSLLDDRPLRRLEGLEKDMEYFYGAEWKTKMTKPTKATETYVNRILEIAKEKDSSFLFIAHQYTRYLGDLFGGQMMGGMASRSMDLPSDGSGVAFYTFEGVPSTKDFITDWYTRLNSLQLTETQKQDIVDEANLVFAFNIGIFQELEGSPWAALWTMAVSGIKEFNWSNLKSSKNK